MGINIIIYEIKNKTIKLQALFFNNSIFDCFWKKGQVRAELI